MTQSQYPQTDKGRTVVPSRSPLMPNLTFSLEAADILTLIAPYCRALAAYRDVPFFEMVLELLEEIPDSVRPRANEAAQKLLISEAFRQLDGRAKSENDILTLLLAMPTQINESFSEAANKNASEIWQNIFPSLQTEIKSQLDPQMQLLKNLTGDQETPWTGLPRSPKRLSLVLEICRKRVAQRFPMERQEQFSWVESWAVELLWAWQTSEGAIEGKDLFESNNQHLLTRVLRAIYHPKCSLPGLPLSEALQHEAFLPLFLETQAAQSALDRLLRTKLDVVPILPQVGETFSPERHTAPRTFWRVAQSSQEKVDTIYEVREIGLERHGRVMVKATVGIIESPALGVAQTAQESIADMPKVIGSNTQNSIPRLSEGSSDAKLNLPLSMSSPEQKPAASEPKEEALW